jgi:hypothetical protein
MKNMSFVVFLVLIVSSGATAQFKNRTDSGQRVGESLVRSGESGLLFGWFDMDRLSMHHSYSLSYMSFGGRGLSVGMYTNSMFYQFSDPLSVQFDVSVMHSPFNNLGNKLGSDLSGIYVTRAELNYKPSDNMLFRIQYRQLPSMYWLNNNRSWDFFGTERVGFEEESR